MWNQLAEEFRPSAAMDARAEAEALEFEGGRFVRDLEDVDIGQNVRRALRYLVEGDALKARHAGRAGAGGHGEDFGELVVRAETEIEPFIGHDDGGGRPADDFKLQTRWHQTTTARHSPAF